MKPAQRVRPAASAASAAVAVSGAPPPAASDSASEAAPSATSADEGPGSSQSGRECYRCGLHLTAKHHPREVSVWGLANRPMKVAMCADCAATGATTAVAH